MTESRARATISTSHELQQHRNQTFKDWTCSRHAFTMLLQRPAQETCPSTLSKVDGCEDGTPCWPSCAGSRTTPTCTDSGAVNNGRLGQKSSMVVPQVLACPTPLLAALPAQVRPPSASEPDGGIISYREPRHAAAPVMSLNNVYQNLFTRYLHNRRWSAGFCRPPRVACLKFLFSPRLFLSLLFNPQQPPEGT